MVSGLQKRELLTGADVALHADIIEADPSWSAADLAGEIHEIDYYLLGGDERLTREVLEQANRLKAISFIGVAAESFVDVKAANDKAIEIRTTPGANSAAVAEFAVGLALAVQRRLPSEILRSGSVMRDATELTGSRVGVLGLGNIGERLAFLLSSGFKCEVRYHSRRRKHEAEESHSLHYTDIGELFAESSTVFVTAAFTESTRGLVGSDLLGVGRNNFLINTSNPLIVDPVALHAALASRRLVGAGFDGYYTEPVPLPQDDSHGLLALEGMMVTRHVAASTTQTWRRMEEAAVRNLAISMRIGDEGQTS